VTRSFQGFQPHLRNLKFSETNVLFGVYCNRTLSNPLLNTMPDECPCGSGSIGTEHLFIPCPRFEEQRRGMVSYTKGQINTKEFVLESENIKPILDFLKRTGIGFTKELRTKVRGKEIEREEEEEELDTTIEAARGNKIGEDDDEDMGGFAFGAFE
jgi:hypothetical protein